MTPELWDNRVGKSYAWRFSRVAVECLLNLIFWHQRPYRPGRACPRASQSLKVAQESPGSMLFTHKPTNPEPLPPSLFYEAFTALGRYCPKHPRARSQRIQDSPPTRLFKLANPKPACPASPIPSCRRHNRASCLCLPFTHSASGRTLVCPLMALHCVILSPPLGNHE